MGTCQEMIAAGGQRLLLDQRRQKRSKLGQVPTSLGSPPHVSLELGRPNGNQHVGQLSRSVNNSSAVANRWPLPSSNSFMAFLVVTFGACTLNGSRFSSATRSNSSRIASDTDSPMACNASVAQALVSLSIRARTKVSALIRLTSSVSLTWLYCSHSSAPVKGRVPHTAPPTISV